MVSRSVGVLTLAVVLALPALAGAQTPTEGFERRGAVYVAALAAVPWSQGLTEDGYQQNPLQPGGHSLGWAVLGGVFASPLVSVEFEVSRTGTVSRRQPSRYDITYMYDRRDTFFSSGVRFHTLRRRGVDLEPVVAFHIVREDQWQTTERRSYVTGLLQRDGPYHNTQPARAGFSAGADLRLGGGRAAFVASFRLHRTFRGGFDEWDTKQWTLVPGAGMRVTF